jgi:hypothetical protein
VADTRKHQSKLSDAEWQKLIDAINELHGVAAQPPAYREFVKLHTDAMTTARGMTWEVHTMMVAAAFVEKHQRADVDFAAGIRERRPAGDPGGAVAGSSGRVC